MWIFKYITDKYCKKIFDAYQSQANKKTYLGIEAELLITRNDFARAVVALISRIEVNNSEDSLNYFNQVTGIIYGTLKDVKEAVSEHNKEFNTEFTADLYDVFFTSSLITFIEELKDLIQKSPLIIINLMDESLFCNDRNVPWVYQFSFVLYDYILEKELDFLINQSARDIFDKKKELVVEHINSAVALFSRFNNENDIEYKSLMNILLQAMRVREHDIQQRRIPEVNSTNNMFAYFTQTYHKASEKIMGKGQLGQVIDILIKEFEERSLSNQPMTFVALPIDESGESQSHLQTASFV